jgi:hypothetical protein
MNSISYAKKYRDIAVPSAIGVPRIFEPSRTKIVGQDVRHCMVYIARGQVGAVYLGQIFIE